MSLLGNVTLGDALALDERLRLFATAQTRVQRCVGQGLGLFYRKGGLLDLNYASKGDYLRESLGLGVREAQEWVRVESLIARYPETEGLWMAGKLNRCHVRLIVGRVAPEDDFVCARLATVMTVRQLREYLVSLGLVDAKDKDGTGRWLHYDASPALREMFQIASEMVNRFLGSDVGQTGCLEACAAEWHATVGPDVFARLEAEGGVVSPAWVAEQLARAEQQRSQREAVRERATGHWRGLPQELPEVHVEAWRFEEDDTTFDIDEGLRGAMQHSQGIEGPLMRALVDAVEASAPAALGFDSVAQYARERLGMSETRTWATLKLGKSLRNCPVLAEAYHCGEVSKSQAQEVVRIATPATLEEWIRYARRTSVRKLRLDVATGLRLRKEDPGQYRDLLPPEAPVLTDTRAQVFLAESLAAMARTSEKPVEELEAPEGSRAEQPSLETDLSCERMSPATHEGMRACRESDTTESAAVAVLSDETPEWHASGQVAVEAASQHQRARRESVASKPFAANPQSQGDKAGELPACSPAPFHLPRVPWMPIIQSRPETLAERVWIPADVEAFIQESLALCRIWLDQPATQGQCIELMVANFLLEYSDEAHLAAKAHPITERDGWGCSVPGCSRKALLHTHHVKPRCEGGLETPDNESTMCSFHHLKCLHEGRMAAVGTAPDQIVWALGIRPDGTPTRVFVGDSRMDVN